MGHSFLAMMVVREARSFLALVVVEAHPSPAAVAFAIIILTPHLDDLAYVGQLWASTASSAG